MARIEVETDRPQMPI